MRIAPLEPGHLDEATALLGRALAHDRVAIVAREKLFGENGARTGFSCAAFSDDGALSGLVALAGRWIKLLAVDEKARGRGLATRLLETARAHAGGRLRLFDHPGNYLSPGVDIRYSAATAFLERRGFRRLPEVENIRAPLDGNPLVTDARSTELDERCAGAGYVVRRAGAEDEPRLAEWIARAFAPVWAFEVRRALAGPRHAVHVAWHGEEPVAFAAADGNNQGLGWFGPAGTDPQHRGRGLGEALLLRCLLDVRGLPEGGVIAWIGPKPFYAKSCGAVDDRRFCAWEEP